jgi:hypothetical protein
MKVSQLSNNPFFRFTQRVKIVGPVFIFVIPYVSYLVAEMFGLSAILA